MFYAVKFRKEYAGQVEAIVEKYVSQEDVKQWYRVSKKKDRKLEKKETLLFSVVSFINYTACESSIKIRLMVGKFFSIWLVWS